MHIDYHKAAFGGERTIDVHYGGRVVFAFHFWPWMLKRWRRWKIELWGQDATFLDVGPCQFSYFPRRRP